MQDPEVKKIKLSSGSVLEVSIYPGFLDKVKEHFGLTSVSSVDDDHIRLYIYDAFKGAIDGQQYGKIETGTEGLHKVAGRV